MITIYRELAGILANCTIISQTGLFVKEKVSFALLENQELPCKYNFIILNELMAEHFEVLHNCRGSIVMAAIYVVMLGVTDFEHPQCGKHMYMIVQTCNVNIQCHLEIFQALSMNIPNTSYHTPNAYYIAYTTLKYLIHKPCL